MKILRRHFTSGPTYMKIYGDHRDSDFGLAVVSNVENYQCYGNSDL